MTLPDRFRAEIARAAERLDHITEQQAREPYRARSWTRKQVLGHLVDSAVNNHNRFIRASLQDEYTGPSYEQQGWVDRLGWAEAPWADILRYWRTYNEVLQRVVSRIPPEKYGVRCAIGGTEGEFTLQGLIEDYLTHMSAHVDQICGRAASA
ncbi:MAG TPA: DinB family protein [Bryobacteraceae bacterium]|nr:DinB family protein [Bryobacteraceae bacterium]